MLFRSGVKGSKMPRGDKEQIMRYKMPTFSSDEEQNIGKIVVDIEKKLQLSRAINDNLPMLGHSSEGAKGRHAA